MKRTQVYDHLSPVINPLRGQSMQPVVAGRSAGLCVFEAAGMIMTRHGLRLSVCASVLMALSLSAICAAPAIAGPSSFTMASQPLDMALRRLADAGRVQILFSGDMVRGRTSASVDGVSDVGAAFECALRPAGLTVRRVNARTFIVVVPPPLKKPVAAPVLPEAGPKSEAIREVLITALRRPMAQRPDLMANGADEMSRLNSVAILTRPALERQPSRTVGEALGALPGMTVLYTGQSFIGGVDSASRAEGMFSAFRGLNTEFNLNMVNEVSLAQGLPYSRGVQLSLLPPAEFQTIVLHKTPRPEMDGDVVGAAVDFQTPTAFDFAARSHFAFSLSTNDSSRAQAYGAADSGEGFSLDYAQRFGAGDQFGLYAATYYERRVFANSEMAGIMSAQNDDGWAYRVSDGPTGANPAGGDPPDNLTQTSLNVGISTGENLSRSHVLSLDWRPDADLQFYLRATSAVTRTTQNSTHSQFIGRDLSWIDDGTGAFRLSVGSVSTRVWYETNPDYAALSSLTFGAHQRVGRWTLSPSAFLSKGESNRPNHIEASVRIDQVDGYNTGTPRAFSGLSILYDSHGWPVPQFTPEIYADFNDASNRLLARRAGQLISQFSEQTRQGGRFDASYQPDGTGALKSLKMGVKYTLSQREMTDRDWTNAYFADIFGKASLTWNDLGITTGYYSAAFPGRYNWRLPKVDQVRLVDYFRQFQTTASFDSCSDLYINNLNCNTQHGKEGVMAVYISALFGGAHFDVAPGLRFERTRIDNTYWVMPPPDMPEVAGHWSGSHSEYRQLLPSLLINYRPDEAHVYRLSIWRAYARPSLFQLGGGVRYDTADDGTPVLRHGNPNLKVVGATNIDLSAQGRFRGALFTLGAYYKGLEHYMFDDGANMAGMPGQSGDIRVITPENGGRAHVQGLEMEAHRSWPRPAGLPGVADLSFNLSRQWTRADLHLETFGRDVPIQNAPDWLGNATLGYGLKGIDISLIYNYTGAYLSAYNTLDIAGDWDNTWVRPSSRLDLSAGWQASALARFDLSVTNLGGGYSYWAHVGEHSMAISDIIDSGRQARLTLRYKY